MDKVWFILLDNKKEGPYSLIDLKLDIRVTPDTFVWKEGFEDWKPIRDVLELKSVFEDEVPVEENSDESDEKKDSKIIQSNEVIALRSDPPFSYLWLLIALILLLFYVLYQLPV